MSDLTRHATWREIHAQPGIWRDWGAALDVEALRDWVYAQAADEVWFCGAGTSAYIGDILAAGFEGRAGFRAVPTTDLVARPAAFLKGRAPLVVSFGRSGNSAESLGTLAALDALAPDAPRLHITCNEGGALARDEKARVVLLPEATHDAGFAMTSSFSTMLLTALAIFGERPDFNGLADALDAALPAFADPGPVPERVVYLGTGPLAFAAREAALKVLELTAGRVPALWDSTLGFRHGPKSFVTQGTAITVFASDNAYDRDLIAELRAQFPQARVTTIGPGGDVPLTLDPLAGAPVYVAASQVAAVIWADALGCNVDDPFAGAGTLSRVVSDVTLYPVAS